MIVLGKEYVIISKMRLIKKIGYLCYIYYYFSMTNIFAYPVFGGDQVLDFNNDGVSLHLGQIADKMCEWEGLIAEQLGLTPADVAAINKKYPKTLMLQK